MPTKRYKRADFKPYTLLAFNEPEVERLLKSCKTSADYLMILLASRYGFRREDIVNLKVRNFDERNKTITYHEKKKNRDRTIPIEGDVAGELVRYKNSIPKNQELFFPFTGVTAWRHLQDICRDAGIPIPADRTGRPFHSLRGSCVKLRQKQGWTIHECAALIGDEPDTVSYYYLTVSNSELAAKMG
jgi:integrase